MSRLILPRGCPICRKPFTPIKHGTGIKQTCGDPHCAGVWRIRQHPENPGLVKGRAVKRAQRAMRIAARTAKLFGPLTDREMEIFAYGELEGYQRGANSVRGTWTKKGTAA